MPKADPKKDETKPEAIKTVRMVKKQEIDGSPLKTPIFADIHPDEVENSKAGGYVHVTDEDVEPGKQEQAPELALTEEQQATTARLKKLTAKQLQTELEGQKIPFDADAKKEELFKIASLNVLTVDQLKAKFAPAQLEEIANLDKLELVNLLKAA